MRPPAEPPSCRASPGAGQPPGPRQARGRARRCRSRERPLHPLAARGLAAAGIRPGRRSAACSGRFRPGVQPGPGTAAALNPAQPNERASLRPGQSRQNHPPGQQSQQAPPPGADQPRPGRRPSRRQARCRRHRRRGQCRQPGRRSRPRPLVRPRNRRGRRASRHPGQSRRHHQPGWRSQQAPPPGADLPRPGRRPSRRQAPHPPHRQPGWRRRRDRRNRPPHPDNHPSHPGQPRWDRRPRRAADRRSRPRPPAPDRSRPHGRASRHPGRWQQHRRPGRRSQQDRRSRRAYPPAAGQSRPGERRRRQRAAVQSARCHQARGSSGPCGVSVSPGPWFPRGSRAHPGYSWHRAVPGPFGRTAAPRRPEPGRRDRFRGSARCRRDSGSDTSHIRHRHQLRGQAAGPAAAPGGAAARQARLARRAAPGPPRRARRSRDRDRPPRDQRRAARPRMPGPTQRPTDRRSPDQRTRGPRRRLLRRTGQARHSRHRPPAARRRPAVHAASPVPAGPAATCCSSNRVTPDSRRRAPTRHVPDRGCSIMRQQSARPHEIRHHGARAAPTGRASPCAALPADRA